MVAAIKASRCDVCSRPIQVGEQVVLCSKRISVRRAVSVPRHPACAARSKPNPASGGLTKLQVEV